MGRETNENPTSLGKMTYVSKGKKDKVLSIKNLYILNQARQMLQ